MRRTLTAAIFAVTLILDFSGCSRPAQTESPAANSDAGSETDVVKTEAREPESIQADLHSSELAGWSFFRGDAQSTGVAKTSLPDELDILWKFSVPQGAFEGTPTIVREREDQSRKTVYIGDLDGSLFALDLESGEIRWEFKSEIGYVTSPVVQDGRIFAGDIDGIFYCLHESGDEIWRFQTQGEIDSSANFYKENVLVGSQDFHLYALNAKTGELAWKYESQDQIRCSATVAGNRAFVAGCDGFFHVVDLESGTEVGSTEIHSPTGATPAALGERVFFGNEQGDFFAVNWQEIKNEWTYTDEEGGNSIRGSAAVTNNHVVFGARNRQLYSLDPKTGRKNWTTRLKAKIDSSPVIVGNRVFVASTDGRLYTIALDDGKVVWEKQFNGGFIGSPAVAFGRLVIATDDGVVYCLGKKK
jgi:outer membrane protein assembly factor BamB